MRELRDRTVREGLDAPPNYEGDAALCKGTRGGLDLGTGVLLRTHGPSASARRVLDLGCGWGVLAVALATEITLETLSSLFATIYMRTWYRLMGARIGNDSEISTNIAGRYDIVDIGDKCFIADEVILGDEDIRRGWMHLAEVKTGSRVFVGNDAVVPPGATIPDGALIGVKSKPPANDQLSPNDTWFGSPPIKLPVRQKMDAGGATWTYSPPWWKVWMRGTFEAVNISLPTMLYITFGTWSVEFFSSNLLRGEYGTALALFFFFCVMISIGMTLVVIGIKSATM